ncbi:aminoacetone oxidase family FAD-binding enzyme [Helicobacter winghamensis]|uniref:aminoacetone oxidase family FAD-binding enzyme n=1 Tax=Helicobacter winghamensis TaxID=157268 RepID=UPI003F87580C
MQSVAIIGGGASGIFCAVLLSLHNIPIVLFEKNKTLGKKLLATGNGRCNIHNIHTNSTHFQSTSFLPKDLQHILQNYPFNAFVKTCQTLGLHFHTQENGKVYPLSNSAKSVLEVFTQALNTNPNLQIHLNTEITTITKSDSNFLLHSHNHTESFSTLILACGSQAAPKLGGSNKGEILAKQLNLKYHQAYPALVPLNLDSTFLSSLSGVKIQAKLTLKENEQILAQTLDDVLFTNYGISGFGVLDLSSFFQTRQNLTLMLDFLPNLTPKTLENPLQNTLKITLKSH